MIIAHFSGKHTWHRHLPIVIFRTLIVQEFEVWLQYLLHLLGPCQRLQLPQVEDGLEWMECARITARVAARVVQLEGLTKERLKQAHNLRAQQRVRVDVLAHGLTAAIFNERLERTRSQQLQYLVLEVLLVALAVHVLLDLYEVGAPKIVKVLASVAERQEANQDRAGFYHVQLVASHKLLVAPDGVNRVVKTAHLSVDFV